MNANSQFKNWNVKELLCCKTQELPQFPLEIKEEFKSVRKYSLWRNQTLSETKDSNLLLTCQVNQLKLSLQNIKNYYFGVLWLG